MKFITQSVYNFVSESICKILTHLLIALPFVILFTGDAQSQEANRGSSQLEEIVVTASRTEESKRKVGSSISVISSEEIERRKVSDMGGLLRTVPGVSISQSGGGAGQQIDVRMRGTEANHTLILMDGVELNIGDNDRYDLANIPLEIIQRIEVLRGPQSVMYGSASIGGVINIVTKGGISKPKTELHFEGGSYETERFSFSRSGSSDDSRYSLVIQHERSDGFSQCNENRGCSEEDGHEQDHFYGSWEKNLTKNLNLEAFFRYTDAMVETDVPGNLSGPGNADPSVNQSDDIERTGKLQLNHSFSDDFNHRFTWSYNTVDNRRQSGAFGTSFRKTDKEKLNYQFNYQYSDRFSLVGGASFEEDEIVSGSGTRENDAYFAELQSDLTEQLFVRVGLRQDDFGADGFNQQTPDETTERFTLVYYPFQKSDLKVRGSWGSGIVRPDLFQLQGGFGVPPNPNLEAEKSEGWEVGLERSILDEMIHLNVSYFDNEIENKIIAGSSGFFGTPSPATNANQVNSEGIELSLIFNASDRLMVEGSYTSMNSEEITATGTTRDLLRRPDEFGSLTTNYSWNPRLDSNLEIFYNGENTQQNFTVVGSPRQTIDSYTRVDLNGEYRLNETISFTGRVDNLFDEDYEEIFGFGTPDQSLHLGMRGQF